MPAIRYFEVEETRVVRVAAHGPAQAGIIAQAAFDHGQNSDNGVVTGKGPVDVWGNTMTRIRTVSINVEEER